MEKFIRGLCLICLQVFPSNKHVQCLFRYKKVSYGRFFGLEGISNNFFLFLGYVVVKKFGLQREGKE